MRLPDPSPVLDKNRAPMGPEILSSIGAGVWRKASMAFPDSRSVLDKFQCARKTVDSYRRFCRNSKTSHRKGGEGGFSGAGNGPIPLREKGGEGDAKWYPS